MDSDDVRDGGVIAYGKLDTMFHFAFRFSLDVIVLWHDSDCI